ncbi:hypothetical protein [Winogradskyella wichelsiae]|uniref:hypothetical protein n=1 Tax=Winogradskyella wichelsiae TaxID=2697007 RepID=UPI003F4AC237
MKLIPKSKDSIALVLVTIIALGMFISGLCNILDYIIVKILLFVGFGSLLIIAIVYAVKNNIKKNRLEDISQDDSL